MGGRGAGFGKSKSVFERGKERVIETVFREAKGFSRSYYKDEILEAVDKGDGHVEFVYASPEKREKTAKTNRTQYLTYRLKAGAENGEIFGVNFENVKSISGQTYNLRSQVKEKGFKWDGKNKRWVK